jgi:hypothetical protein
MHVREFCWQSVAPPLHCTSIISSMKARGEVPCDYLHFWFYRWIVCWCRAGTPGTMPLQSWRHCVRQMGLCGGRCGWGDAQGLANSNTSLKASTPKPESRDSLVAVVYKQSLKDDWHPRSEYFYTQFFLEWVRKFTFTPSRTESCTLSVNAISE